MLQQNWFFDSRYELFHEYYDKQVFYDVETECFYIVTDIKDRIVIIQVEPLDDRYDELLATYLLWRKSQKSVDK